MVRHISSKDKSFRLRSKPELLGLCFKRRLRAHPWTKKAMTKALSKDKMRRVAVRAARRKIARLEQAAKRAERAGDDDHGHRVGFEEVEDDDHSSHRAMWPDRDRERGRLPVEEEAVAAEAGDAEGDAVIDDDVVVDEDQEMMEGDAEIAAEAARTAAAAAEDEMEAAAAAARDAAAAVAEEDMQQDALLVDQVADPFVLPAEEGVAVKEEDEGELDHEEEDDGEGEEEEDTGGRRDTNQKEILRCERDVRCPYVAGSKKKLNKHHLHHDLDFPIKCPLCSYSVEKQHHMDAHTKDHLAAAGGQAKAATVRSRKAEEKLRLTKKRKKEVRNKLEEFKRTTSVLPEPHNIKPFLEIITPHLIHSNFALRLHAISTLSSLTRMHGERPEFLCYFNRLILYAVGLLKDSHQIKESCCELLLLAAQTVYKFTRTTRVIEEFVRVTDVPIRHHVVDDYPQLAVAIVNALAHGAETMRWLRAQHYVEQAMGLMEYPMPQAVRVAAALLLQALLSKLDAGQRANIDQPRLRAALRQLGKIDAVLARKINELV